MRLGGIVILYNPILSDVKNNIEKYLEHLDMLVVWDNTPGGTPKIKETLTHPKLHMLGTGNNEGIPKALNEAFHYIDKTGCDYILTMDQDSEWEDFAQFKSNVEKNLDLQYGIYAPQIKSKNVVLRVNSTSNVITSGSIVSISAFKKVGGFNEKLFIDEVDNEFCYRLRRNNYKIKLFPSSYLVQIFGSPKNNGYLSKYTANYSSFRTYHQIRNRLWVWKEYHDMLSYKYIMRTILFQIIRRSLLILLIEDSKRSKLLSIFRGIKDGLRQNLK
ncbi:MAG: glycosyltransferase [Bacteroides sp.]|nr:glycosyltransferase [Bacteroides sp.]MBD5307448.1 glycosyltransferase [Bacteroides sp.]